MNEKEDQSYHDYIEMVPASKVKDLILNNNLKHDALMKNGFELINGEWVLSESETLYRSIGELYYKWFFEADTGEKFAIEQNLKVKTLRLRKLLSPTRNKKGGEK